MKKWTRHIVAAGVLLAGGIGPTVGAQTVPMEGNIPLQGIPIDGYAAVVNDRVITVSDVMALVQPIERQLKEAYSGTELEERIMTAYRDARDSLIERALILEEFKGQKGTLPEQMVDERVDEIIRERFNNDRVALFKILSEERITPEDWREQVREQLIISLLRRQEVTSRVTVSPSAVRELYDARRDDYRVPAKVKLRMIVLNKGNTEEDIVVKREQARQVLEKLEANEDFATLAREVSEGSKAARGGGWGWTDPAILRDELASAMKDLEPGQPSGVVETEDELYILQIDARRNESVTSFAEVEDELNNELRQADVEHLHEMWISRLKNKYIVKIY